MNTHLVIDPKLKALFDQMPGCWGCKDKKSTFLYANKEYAKLIGIPPENHLSIIGKTDSDMPCDTVHCADLFREQDKNVMLHQKQLRILDIHPFAMKTWKAYIFTKTPLYDDEKNVIGTIFHGCDVTHTSILELGLLLSKISETPQHCLLKNQTSYLLDNAYQKIHLTEREEECLFFLIRGKSAKMIAQYLHISPRTAETHIDHLKFKFHAANKSEVIHNAMQAGYLNFVPEKLFNTQLSIILKDE